MNFLCCFEPFFRYRFSMNSCSFFNCFLYCANMNILKLQNMSMKQVGLNSMHQRLKSILHETSNCSHSVNDNHQLNFVQRVPVGVAVLNSPWNLPLYLLTWKIAPCIAYGNTCVCKPSEMTSLTAYKLCKILNKVGLPKKNLTGSNCS